MVFIKFDRCFYVTPQDFVMSSITEETITHVANLARLDLTQDELQQYSQELTKIIAMVEQMNHLDLNGIEVGMTEEQPTSFREDVVNNPFERDKLLKNAPDQEDGFFRVPKILDEASE